MKRSRLLTFAALTALAAAIACSDIVSPNRVQRYDWRLVLNYDSAATTFVDTLSYHWPRSSLPVRIWVEDQNDIPARVREGIALWKDAFLYGEWDGKIVSDSNTADVLIRTVLPPPEVQGNVHMNAMAASCEGATDVDTVASRHELRLPVRVYIIATLPGAPDIHDCLQAVAAHELGHSLGLFQHSTDSLDLMYSFPTRNFLTDRDLGTAYNAYHFQSDMVPVRPEN
jgi:predicted Zn-dependent protease